MYEVREKAVIEADRIDDDEGRCLTCQGPLAPAGRWGFWRLVECQRCGITGPTGRPE